MALLYRARLTPSKPQLLADWLPGRPWAADFHPASLRILGHYRFDDPAGQVGIDSHLLADDAGTVVHVPLSYRPAPVPGLDDHLVGVTEHSVLGRRWCYDGCADPVVQQAFLTAIFGGGVQAEMDVAENREAAEHGLTERRELLTLVQGSGTSAFLPRVERKGALLESDDDLTVLRFAEVELSFVRRIGVGAVDPVERFGADDDETLMGTWPGQDDPRLLAFARRSR